jgi:hypothetical protein
LLPQPAQLSQHHLLLALLQLAQHGVVLECKRQGQLNLGLLLLLHLLYQSLLKGSRLEVSAVAWASEAVVLVVVWEIDMLIRWDRVSETDSAQTDQQGTIDTVQVVLVCSRMSYTGQG